MRHAGSIYGKFKEGYAPSGFYGEHRDYIDDLLDCEIVETDKPFYNADGFAMEAFAEELYEEALDDDEIFIRGNRRRDGRQIYVVILKEFLPQMKMKSNG